MAACACLALVPNALVTPFAAVKGAIRLTRGLTGDVARPATPG